MKKQDVLEAMRAEAGRIIKNYEEEKEDISYREWLRAISGLAAIEGIASRIFGFQTEEEEEFKFYRKNFDKQFPQPKQIDE